MNNITITNILPNQLINIWNTQLWRDRNSPIKLTSSMMLNGGYDLSYHKQTPYCWGIIADNNIIAVQSGHKCNNLDFRIRGLWVDDKYRNKGLARLLFNNAEQVATSLGCTIIWSYPRNSSLEVYKKCGYKISTGPINDITECYGPYWYVYKKLNNVNEQ